MRILIRILNLEKFGGSCNIKINAVNYVIDVWRGVWRCTHVKLVHQHRTFLPGIATTGLRRDKGRSGIGCWVAVAMGCPCRSHAISILQRIVRVTKAATWSHPSALFSIRGGSPIFSRVVIASSRYSRNVGHSNRVCQASSFRPLVSQLEHSGYPPASCGTSRR